MDKQNEAATKHRASNNRAGNRPHTVTVTQLVTSGASHHIRERAD